MMVTVRRSLILLACLVLCWAGDLNAETVWESPGQVWKVGARRWDVAEEHRFAAWVEHGITDDFFIRHRIPVDCADVPYAIRWFYARMAHLPAAATMGDGRLFGHWSTAFAHLPTHHDWHRDQRFRMALLSVLGETTTRTLPADTYPIRIAPDSLLPGTASIVPDSHAGMVGSIVLDGSRSSPVQTWEATLPRKIRKLLQRSYSSTWPDIDIGSGLVRFRWPISIGQRWGYLPKEEHPFYSLEQYNPDFCNPGELFDEAVARRIDPTPYDPAEKVATIMSAVRRYLDQRVALVLDGYRHCQRGNCPEGSNLWEVYSTPNRDSRIGFEIEHLLNVIKSNGLDEEELKKTMERMVIPIDHEQTVTLNYVVQNYLWLSHDPADPIAARWGLSKCKMISARMQIALQDLSFVEQRYRVTDPDYADLGRRLHLKDLRWLQDEGKRANCGDLPPLPQEGSLPSNSADNKARE